jgi:hypothetical protein
MPVIKLERFPKKHEKIYGGDTKGFSLSERSKAIKALWGRGRPLLAEQINIGELLTDYKHTVVVGKWREWVKKRLPLSERTARTYMGLYCAYKRGYVTGGNAAREEAERADF